MVDRGSFGMPARRAVLLLCLAFATLLAISARALRPHRRRAQTKRCCCTPARPVSVTPMASTAVARSSRAPSRRPATRSTGRTAPTTAAAATNCDNADKNPRIFTDANLARYDAIVLLNASAGPPGPLWSDAQKASIIKYVQNGGGIAGIHNATDMGTTADDVGLVGRQQRQLGRRRHDARPRRDRPQQHRDGPGRGPQPPRDPRPAGHVHVRRRALQLQPQRPRRRTTCSPTLDERTYTPGGNAMGQDHPVTWCKLYDGDNINDNTGTPKNYSDGRTWVTSMGHFGASYTAQRRQQQLREDDRRRRPLGRGRGPASPTARAPSGPPSPARSSSPTRTTRSASTSPRTARSTGRRSVTRSASPPTGYVKMYDPAKPAGNKTTVISIPTRADHGNSEDGVLGMSLQPGFDLTDPAKRNIFVYYSPRNAAWPTSGNVQVVGYNQISRFTLTADGTAAEPGLRARDPARPQGQDLRLARPASRAARPTPAPATSAAPAWTSTPPATSTSASATTSPRTRPATTATRRWTTGPPSAGTRARRRRTPPTCAARSSASRPSRATIPADTEPGVDATYDDPGGQPVPGRHGQDPSRDLRDGLPPAVHAPHRPGQPRHHRHGRVLPRQLGQRRRPLSGRYLRVEPDQQGGQLRLAVLRRQQLGGQHHLPLELRRRRRTTGQQYDCSLATLPSDIRYAPAGETPVEPTFDGLDTFPTPDQPGDDLEEVRGRRRRPEHGRLR